MVSQNQPQTSDRVARNLQLMKKGDDGFNLRDEAYYEAAHHPDLVAYIMGSTEPLRGRKAHGAAMQGLYRAFPDIRVDNDYSIQFGSGDWTTVIARVSGTFTGELVRPDGTVIQGTGKFFEVALTTTARWEDDQMVEEWVFWDTQLMAEQIGLA